MKHRATTHMETAFPLDHRAVAATKTPKERSDKGRVFMSADGPTSLAATA